MSLKLDTPIARLVTVGLVVLAYFLVYPEDVTAVVAPVATMVKGIAAPLASVLQLSTSVSPWLYGVIAVGIVAWTIVRVWGGRTARPAGGAESRQP